MRWPSRSAVCRVACRSTTEDDLRRAFEKFGRLEDVRVTYEPSGRPRGFAFVTFMERVRPYRAPARTYLCRTSPRRAPRFCSPAETPARCAPRAACALCAGGLTEGQSGAERDGYAGPPHACGP